MPLLRSHLPGETDHVVLSPAASPVRCAGWSRLPPEYAIPATAPSLAEAQEYCRRLARTHYENFSVATWFLPERLRQHFFNVYAYCRISDDLGDEVGDPAASLELLDQWQAELDACYAGTPRHPVFVALAETVRQFEIPQHEFRRSADGLSPGPDVTRYETFDDLLGYCRYSANPVGHLVLYLCGYRDAERQKLSDFTCTALQLANFWQDVSVDYAKGRIYLPLEDLRRYGVSEDDIASSRNTPAFCEMMRFEVERARDWFRQGLPLVGKVDRELAIDLELFSRGGQEILNAIEKQGYAVLGQRPAISKTRKLALVARAALGKLSYEHRRAAQCPVASSRPPRRSSRWRIRCAAASRAPRPRISTTPFWCCRRQAQGAVRGLCLHAALRRHRRRRHPPAARTARQSSKPGWTRSIARKPANPPTTPCCWR